MVNATDPDQGTGGSVLFSFQPPSPFFAIDGARGTVTVTKPLDYETTSAYQLTVNATVSKRVPMSARSVKNNADALMTPHVIWFSGSGQSEASVAAGKPGDWHHRRPGHGPHLYKSAVQYQHRRRRSLGQCRSPPSRHTACVLKLR